MILGGAVKDDSPASNISCSPARVLHFQTPPVMTLFWTKGDSSESLICWVQHWWCFLGEDGHLDFLVLSPALGLLSPVVGRHQRPGSEVWKAGNGVVEGSESEQLGLGARGRGQPDLELAALVPGGDVHHHVHVLQHLGKVIWVNASSVMRCCGRWWY